MEATIKETKVKWDNHKVLDVIHEARNVGCIAAQKKLDELKSAGAKYALIDDVTNKIVDIMLDVCGFAHLKISARGKFYLLARKLSDNE